MSFQNKVVFVAGGTSGINLGIAEVFAEDGARVVVLSRNQERVDAAVAHLRGMGGEAMGFAADVRQYQALSDAMAATVTAWGPIDVLISGAAGNFVVPAAELSANGFKTVIDIDLLGAFNVMRAALPHLRKPGASIVNISAPQSTQPTPHQIHVCAAKAGADQVTRVAAMEWGPMGVRVNAISPGPIADTEGMRRLAPTPASEKAWTQSVPLRRFGTKREIGLVARWLCSEEASYINGVVLPVDGGFALGGSSAQAHNMHA
ncbi:SDR family oxidoreductase [Ramlibacter sp. WS9]|uniref:SDR family oxidoreductase n=1 Tax=Ramlibacter sp. WS9 TaxID=1882741 RepID=UPI001144EA65|nr:SDR family oxidoreductase [Ramlibacter sp. WS9]ROZ68814.1 SDR family oxidoreductase [Ramlibacter sp. WS9]